MWIWEGKEKDVAKRSGFHAFLFLLLGSGLIDMVEASRHVRKNMTTSSGLVGASPGEAAKLRVSWLALSKAVRVQTSMGKGGGWLVTGTSFSAPQVGPECEGVKKCPYLLGRGCGGLIVSLDHQRSALRRRGLCVRDLMTRVTGPRAQTLMVDAITMLSQAHHTLVGTSSGMTANQSHHNRGHCRDARSPCGLTPRAPSMTCHYQG